MSFYHNPILTRLIVSATRNERGTMRRTVRGFVFGAFGLCLLLSLPACGGNPNETGSSRTQGTVAPDAPKNMGDFAKKQIQTQEEAASKGARK